jgi:diguanylate cyclase (GGDEF)-like protein
VLREVARRIVGSVRNYDYVGRYGGEEFLVVLTECSPSDLVATAERIRSSVSERPIETETGLIAVTISGGLAAQHLFGLGHPKGDLLRAADAALYRAKANGRNRVESAPEVIADCLR